MKASKTRTWKVQASNDPAVVYWAALRRTLREARDYFMDDPAPARLVGYANMLQARWGRSLQANLMRIALSRIAKAVTEFDDAVSDALCDVLAQCLRARANQVQLARTSIIAASLLLRKMIADHTESLGDEDEVEAGDILLYLLNFIRIADEELMDAAWSVLERPEEASVTPLTKREDQVLPDGGPIPDDIIVIDHDLSAPLILVAPDARTPLVPDGREDGCIPWMTTLVLRAEDKAILDAFSASLAPPAAQAPAPSPHAGGAIDEDIPVC